MYSELSPSLCRVVYLSTCFNVEKVLRLICYKQLQFYNFTLIIDVYHNKIGPCKDIVCYLINYSKRISNMKPSRPVSRVLTRWMHYLL